MCGLGQYVIGTFTADSTSEVITFTGAPVFVSITYAAQLNAMQLRVVPEPSVALLFVAGGAAVLLVGQFRRSA